MGKNKFRQFSFFIQVLWFLYIFQTKLLVLAAKTKKKCKRIIEIYSLFEKQYLCMECKISRPKLKTLCCGVEIKTKTHLTNVAVEFCLKKIICTNFGAFQQQSKQKYIYAVCYVNSLKFALLRNIQCVIPSNTKYFFINMSIVYEETVTPFNFRLQKIKSNCFIAQDFSGFEFIAINWRRVSIAFLASSI